MGRTIGDVFGSYKLEVRQRLMRRYKAVAIELCKRHRFHDSEPDDLVQEALKALVPKEYKIFPSEGAIEKMEYEDLFPKGAPITLIWRIIERKIIDALRKRWQQPLFSDLSSLHSEEGNDEGTESAIDRFSFKQGIFSPGAEQHMIDRETLRAFISETEGMVARFELILGSRRRDFRERVAHLFNTFCTDPHKYIYPLEETDALTVRIRVSEFIAALGWRENVYQQFKARLDSMLLSSGLSLERLFLGILIHVESEELGLVSKRNRLGEVCHD